MSPPPADPGEWYVAFMGVARMGWWDWVFTRPGFRHVLAFAYSSHAQRWLIYDVERDRTRVRAYRSAAFDAWLRQLPAETTILKLTTEPLRTLRVQRLLFICTTAVIHLIGARSRALRPERLYRDLLGSGATHAFGTGPFSHAQTQGRPSAGERRGQGRAAG